MIKPNCLILHSVYIRCVILHWVCLCNYSVFLQSNFCHKLTWNKNVHTKYILPILESFTKLKIVKVYSQLSQTFSADSDSDFYLPHSTIIYHQERLKFSRNIQTSRILLFKIFGNTKIQRLGWQFILAGKPADWFSFPPGSKKGKEEKLRCWAKSFLELLYLRLSTVVHWVRRHSAATEKHFLTAFASPLPLTIDNVKVSNVKRYEDRWEFKAMQQLLDSPNFLFCLSHPWYPTLRSLFGCGKHAAV